MMALSGPKVEWDGRIVRGNAGVRFSAKSCRSAKEILTQQLRERGPEQSITCSGKEISAGRVGGGEMIHVSRR
jgi:hypothetical protein